MRILITCLRVWCDLGLEKTAFESSGISILLVQILEQIRASDIANDIGLMIEHW